MPIFFNGGKHDEELGGVHMSAVPAIVEIAIEAETPAGRSSLRQAVDHLVSTDPRASTFHDGESAQIRLRGTDVKHLDVLIGKLRREVGMPIVMGSPQVVYREAFAQTVDVDFAYSEISGSTGQFARVKLKIEPGPRGQGVCFVDALRRNGIPNFPDEYIPAVERGIRETAMEGGFFGFPIIDFTARLEDSAYHDLDSSQFAFEMAARGAMRRAVEQGETRLLEPIMRVAILTRKRWLVHIGNDLMRRRAVIDDTGEGRDNLITATAPMAALFGIEEDLMALTGREAAIAMLWHHYEEVPPNPREPDDDLPAAAALRA